MGLPVQIGMIVLLASCTFFIGGCRQDSKSTLSNSTTGAPSNGNPIVSGTAILKWDAPTQRADGSALDDLSGFKVHYGTAPGSYSKVVDVGNQTDTIINGLDPSFTYYFAITAYDSTGNESTYSNEASKSFQ